MVKIKSFMSSEKVFSNAKEAFDLFETQRFGERDGDKIFYSLSECMYLIDAGKMEVYSLSDKLIAGTKLFASFQKVDKKFKIKYSVFKDLRKKGYVVKSALKFGAEFRVYEKGKDIGEDHSKWICYSVAETEHFTWHDFSAKNRVAHSTNKNLLIAVVDEENAVSYYEVDWVRI